MYINGCRSVTSGCLNVFDPVMNKQWLFFCPQGDHAVIKFVDKETLLKEKQQQLEVYFWSVPSYVRLCNCCVYLVVIYSARFYIFGLGTREEAETEGGSQKEVGSGKGLTGDIVFCFGHDTSFQTIHSLAFLGNLSCKSKFTLPRCI